MGSCMSRNSRPASIRIQSLPSGSAKTIPLQTSPKTVKLSLVPVDNSSNKSSTYNIIAKSNSYLNPKQLDSIRRIQRSVRRKKAIRNANIQQQWKIFADLDTKDEAEMLHLAMFFQTLLDRVPNADKYTSTRQLNYDPNSPVSDSEPTSPFEAALGPNKDSYDNTIFLDNIQIMDSTDEHITIHGDKSNYDIGKANLTEAIVQEIIEVCRQGGKLHLNTIVKILRTSYKMLKNAANINRVNLSLKSKCTVVGDLHGNLYDLLYILDNSGMPSSDHTYVFNGDFVDRGEHSTEVIAILLALISIYPDYVFLNRGNHEG